VNEAQTLEYLKRLTSGELVIATSCFSRYETRFGVPVRTTIGAPKTWKHPTAELENISELAPYGVAFVEKYDTNLELFEEAYVKRLRKHEQTIWDKLHALHEKYDGEPLVLLCYERNPAECHRSMAATWFGGFGVFVHEAPRHLANAGPKLAVPPAAPVEPTLF